MRALLEHGARTWASGPTYRQALTWLVLALAIALPACFARTTFLVAPTADGLWRGLADPPSGLRVALSLTLGAAAATALRRTPFAVRRPLLVGLLAAAPWIPVLTGHALPLLAFTGPTMRILLCGAAAVALVRAWTARGSAPAIPETLLPVGALAFHVAFGFYWPGPAGAQGDEPHYLMMSESLLQDRDLDLRNQLDARASPPLYPGRLTPHLSHRSPPEHAYSHHPPGLAVLLVPAYALGGVRGARLFLSVLGALTTWLSFRHVRDSTGSSSQAWVAAAALTLTPPFAFYALSIYPETVAALGTALFLVASSPGAAGWVPVAALLAATALPWLHPKFLPLALVGLLLTLRVDRRRLRLAVALFLSVGIAGTLLFFAAHFGQMPLDGAYGKSIVDAFSLGQARRGTAGLLFDRQFGLFAIAPLWMVALPGIVALARHSPGEAARASLLAATVFGVGAAFSLWWGGASPPARFLVPCLPAAAVAFAHGAARRPGLAAGLLGAGVGVVTVAAEMPRITHNRGDGVSALLEALARGLDLGGRLPSFVHDGPDATVLAASLLGVFALAWLRGARGLIWGVTGYALLATALRPGPILDARGATLALIDGYGGRALVDVSRTPRLESLSLPVELPKAPWDLRPGVVRLSGRLDLAPGLYRVVVEAAQFPSPPGAAAGLVEVLAGTRRLGAAHLQSGQPHPSVMIDLPAGARRLAVRARGLKGITSLRAIRIVPARLYMRKERAR